MTTMTKVYIALALLVLLATSISVSYLAGHRVGTAEQVAKQAKAVAAAVRAREKTLTAELQEEHKRDIARLRDQAALMQGLSSEPTCAHPLSLCLRTYFNKSQEIVP